MLQTEQQLLAIAEALRVAYIRGSRDPEKKEMTATIIELRDWLTPTPIKTIEREADE